VSHGIRRNKEKNTRFDEVVMPPEVPNIANDVQVTCCDCERVFTVCQGEIAWYTEKGWSPPVRCKSCREARRKERERGTQGR
jgi:hypothetical protein